MSELDKLIKTRIKHTGIFDFKELYRILYEWFIDKDYDFNEKNYKEVVQPGNAKEIELEWECVRKVSDYFKYHIKAKWHIVGMTTIEVEIDGVKKKMNQGQFELIVECTLIKDYEDRWVTNPFFKTLRTFYDKYIIRESVTQYEGKLIGEMEEFVAQAKSFLALSGKR